MNEAQLWRKLKNGLEKASHKEIFLQRHEDKICPGLPDVSYCYRGNTGWIELKYLPCWPKNLAKVGMFDIKHYTPAQKLWAKKYVAVGGNYFLYLQVGKEAFMWVGSQAYGWPKYRVFSGIRKPDYTVMLGVLKDAKTSSAGH